MVLRAGLYGRLSEVRAREGAEARETSTDRQLGDMLGWCERSGATPHRTYREEGISAYTGRHRPEFERLLADLDAGELDAVVCWRLDRLARNHADFQRLWEACEQAGARLVSLHEGFDSGTPVGELVVRMLVSMAKWESQSISMRVKRAVESAVKEGRPHGGGRRPFGYDRAGNVVPAEAESLAWAAGQVLAGRSLRSVVAALTARGIAGTGGGHLTGRSLKHALVGPRSAGLRTHRGELVPGNWPAILSREQHEGLKAVLRPGVRTGRPAAHLLTGFLVCGHPGCGGRLFYSSDRRQPPRYECGREDSSHNSAHLTVSAHQVERLITGRVLDRLDHGGLAAALDARQDLGSRAVAEQLTDDEAALVRLSSDHYVHRLIGRAEFLASRQALEDRIRSARDSLARHARHAALSGVPTGPGALRAAWPDLTLEQQRAVVGLVLDHAIIKPAVRKGRVFDPDRVVIPPDAWRA
jgi:DNA invertase Pin-like site-specific DNA recombinase